MNQKCNKLFVKVLNPAKSLIVNYKLKNYDFVI
jgi:hypothetical protein